VLVSASISQNSSSSSPLSGQSDVQENFILSGDTESLGMVSRPKNLIDHQDLLSGNVEGSPECLTDSCKDHLRLRRLFVGEKSTICIKSSGSSYNSPIGRCSPLMSPSGADPAGIKALNLDPSCPQVPDDVYREFKEFKQQKQLEALKALSESFKKELEPRSPRTAGIQTQSKCQGVHSKCVPNTGNFSNSAPSCPTKSCFHAVSCACGDYSTELP
jgi:hypothetical protein